MLVSGKMTSSTYDIRYKAPHGHSSFGDWHNKCLSYRYSTRPTQELDAEISIS
jgi:hypothetical protein